MTRSSKALWLGLTVWTLMFFGVAGPASGETAHSGARQARTQAVNFQPVNRYRYHNGRWWYWGNNNSWLIWSGNQWSPYVAPAPGVYAPRAYAYRPYSNPYRYSTGYRGYYPQRYYQRGYGYGYGAPYRRGAYYRGF